MINVFQPALGEEELTAVADVFASNWIGKGRLTAEFEAAFAAHLGSDPALVRSVSCCTEGLFQALALLNVGAGDEVILPTISFVGAGNAVVAAGARPVFCDVNRRTLNATAETIAPHITPRTRAVIILHYGGVPPDMDAIAALCAERGIALVEDAACSVASAWNGRACGTFGDVAVWSFDAMKILVTGDGGMVRCRTAEMAGEAEQRLYLGLETASGLSSREKDRWWEFEVGLPGRRAIMNDVASAIGLAQLRKLPDFIARRRQVHVAYEAALAGEGWLERPPAIPAQALSSYYFYWVQTPHRDRLASFLRENGIYTTFRYYPLHWVDFYGSEAELPGAEQAARTTLCLPLHHALTDEEVGCVVAAVRRFGRERI